MSNRIVWMGLLALFLASCNPDDDELVVPPGPVSPVKANLDSLPYATLSEYNFYQGNMVDLEPVYGVVPYDVITPLFTDYAKKKRFIWMPAGAKANYNGDHDILQFQDGTILIKNFYYNNVQPLGNTRVIETRLEFLRNGVWEFAEYVWNEEQTEAYLDMEGSFTDVSFIRENGEQLDINYRIPSAAECLTCHKMNDNAIPIGPKPQNINMNYAYKDGVKNQLLKLEEMGYLAGDYPLDIVSLVDWEDPDQLLSERVRSYLDMNCGHCHRESSHCDYRPIKLAFSETNDLFNLGVCVEPDELIEPSMNYIINAGSPGRSMMYYRVSSDDESVRMPLLGRSIVHEEGVDLLFEYISSLNEDC